MSRSKKTTRGTPCYLFTIWHKHLTFSNALFLLERWNIVQASKFSCFESLIFPSFSEKHMGKNNEIKSLSKKTISYTQWLFYADSGILQTPRETFLRIVFFCNNKQTHNKYLNKPNSPFIARIINMLFKT